MLFEQGETHFHVTQGSTKSVAGPLRTIAVKNIMPKMLHMGHLGGRVVDCPILGFSSSYELRVVRPSPMTGSTQRSLTAGVRPAGDSLLPLPLPLQAPPHHMLMHSLSSK